MSKWKSLLNLSQLGSVKPKGGWQGGPNFITRSKYGSKGSNGKMVRGRTRYSCGTERAYIGDIMRECYANWKGRMRNV